MLSLLWQLEVSIVLYNAEKWSLVFFLGDLPIFWLQFNWNVSGVVLYQSYEFCPNHGSWLVAMATKRLHFRHTHTHLKRHAFAWRIPLHTHIHTLFTFDWLPWRTQVNFSCIQHLQYFGWIYSSHCTQTHMGTNWFSFTHFTHTPTHTEHTHTHVPQHTLATTHTQIHGPHNLICCFRLIRRLPGQSVNFYGVPAILNIGHFNLVRKTLH